MPSPAERLATAWKRLSPLPGGHIVLGLLLRFAVPYSASVRPRILHLEPGHATVVIRDRRHLRNHLRSVHALALANVAELASGLAMTLALPPGVRGIPVRIETDYLKKARGPIRAEGHASPPATVADDTDTEAEAHAELYDEAGEVVCRTVVRWRLRPE